MQRFVFLFISILVAATPSVHSSTRPSGFGKLASDPQALIDLPARFTYLVVSRPGDEMSDGLVVPPLADGMGAFPGPQGTCIVVRNHETFLAGHGPFGENLDRRDRVPTAKIYDPGMGVTPCPGGTTTFVWDTRQQKLVRQFLSLTGTLRNCAGSVTPWGSWLTCEENVSRAGVYPKENLHLQRDHGYVFDVPATAEPALAEPTPLTALGRFYHEGAAFDTKSGVLYMTEDLTDGLLYRFVPEKAGDLRQGRLQAAMVDNGRTDLRNHANSGPAIPQGERMRVRWIDLDDVEAPKDDLRTRGREDGAAIFDRGEGMVEREGAIFFTATGGGAKVCGQIWCYVPSPHEGTDDEADAPGTLELYLEPNDKMVLNAPDNISVAPWGDLVVCEDPYGETARVVTVARDRSTAVFASARIPSEFAGAAFSPDGTTLFLNLQIPGITLAITGPWPQLSSSR